jgi:hypothetical protein
MGTLALSEKSNILILTICSNTKITSGEIIKGKYTGGIINFLPQDLVDPLYGVRYKMRNLITSGKVSRHGKLLREMPFNADLIDGPEFNGNRSEGLYMPAIQRYNGRFFRSLGDEQERVNLASVTKHHLLIISGLYGILTPSELIQCYSCHVPDHPDIARYWTENDLLTELILAYIKRFNINKVFDFMADDSYRNLISWGILRDATNKNVLHCFSEQFAGPALLPSLGFLSKEFLTNYSKDDLFNIAPYEKIKIPNDEINFLPSNDPIFPLAREMEELKIETKDKIGRIRRNYINILGVALQIKDIDYFGSFSENVNKLRRIVGRHEPDIAGKMKRFNEIRVDSEYHQYDTSEEWKYIIEDYRVIVEWAQKNGYTMNIILEKIE